MDMVKTSMEDGPVSNFMLGKRVIDDGGEEGAEHLGFKSGEILTHCRAGVDLIVIFLELKWWRGVKW